MRELITTKQYAEYYGCDVSTVRYKCIKKELDAKKIGRDWMINPPLDYKPEFITNEDQIEVENAKWF